MVKKFRLPIDSLVSYQYVNFFSSGENKKLIYVIKERDEWSNFAEFVGAMVAKYADKMDFESLPDPDLYLLKRDMLDWYKAYNRARQKKVYFDVEYVKHA